MFFPNGFGDVDICLRALDAGYRNYYLGSLEGIHHEALSRGFPIEDIEFTRLHERHGQTIAVWRPRHLNRASRHSWPLPVLPCNELSDASAEIDQAVRLSHCRSATGSPTRSSRFSSTALGPAYMGVRTAAVKSAKLCLRLKSPGGFIPSSG